MPNSDLLPTLFSKFNETQIALGAAIMELAQWVERHGGVEATANVRGALEILDYNDEFIKLTLAVLMNPE